MSPLPPPHKGSPEKSGKRNAAKHSLLYLDCDTSSVSSSGRQTTKNRAKVQKDCENCAEAGISKVWTPYLHDLQLSPDKMPQNAVCLSHGGGGVTGWWLSVGRIFLKRSWRQDSFWRGRRSAVCPASGGEGDPGCSASSSSPPPKSPDRSQ